MDARTKERSTFLSGLASPRFWPRTCSSFEVTLMNEVIQQMTFSPFLRRKVIMSVSLVNPGNNPSNVQG